LVCNNLCNSVATRIIRPASLLIILNMQNPARAQSITPDDTCVAVRNVFVGMNDIAKKGNTKITPFSKPYLDQLETYFGRGCPASEPFPLPTPGTDMRLGNVCADVVAGGKIKMKLGDPLLR
jgi:hypothetical protein